MRGRDQLAGALVRLYPRPWRDRYGDEFLALIDDTGLGWRQAGTVCVAAAEERAVRAVKRVLGDGREDQMIRTIARGVVHFLAAWAATTTVIATSAVLSRFARPEFALRTSDGVQQMVPLWLSSRDMYLAGFRALFFLATSLPFVVPVVILFKRTAAGRARLRAARLVTIAVCAVVGLTWQLSLPSYNRLSMQLCLSLAAGGTIIARAVFPRFVGVPTNPAL
jgi:hypothetical protein